MKGLGKLFLRWLALGFGNEINNAFVIKLIESMYEYVAAAIVSVTFQIHLYISKDKEKKS